MTNQLETIKDILQRLLDRKSSNTPGQKIYDELPPTPEQVRVKYLSLAGVTNPDNTFANMHHPKGFDKVYNAFVEMAQMDCLWSTLMVYGGSGNGKSLCCEALVIDLYDKGIKTKRERWADIVRFTLKAAMNSRRQDASTYEEVFKRLQERPFLIIDDVGMGSTGGSWEWGELEDIVDYRIEHRLPTVITTNLDLKEIPPRIVSRLRNPAKCRLIFNEASDQRPVEGKL